MRVEWFELKKEIRKKFCNAYKKKEIFEYSKSLEINNEILKYIYEVEGYFENIARLIKLSSVLPISNAGIERTFSSLSFIKSKLRNRLLDPNLESLLFVYNFQIN
jgi:hypothetical protein